VVAVGVVDAHQDFHLGLSPEARAVGRAQSDAGIKVSVGVLAIAAGELDSWLVLRIFSQVIVRQNLKAGLLAPVILSSEWNSIHFPPALTPSLSS